MPSSTASPSTWWNTGQVRGVGGLAPVDAPGRDDVDGRRLRLHRADLHRGRLGAQQEVRAPRDRDVERVLHRPGRVILGMFSAWKLCQSSSISGPSATRNPRLVNTSTIRLGTIVSGWSDPAGGAPPGQRHVEPVRSQERALGLELERRPRLERGRRAPTAPRSRAGRRSRRHSCVEPAQRLWTSLNGALRPEDLHLRGVQLLERGRRAANSATPRSRSSSSDAAHLAGVHRRRV